MEQLSACSRGRSACRSATAEVLIVGIFMWPGLMSTFVQGDMKLERAVRAGDELDVQSTGQAGTTSTPRQAAHLAPARYQVFADPAPVPGRRAKLYRSAPPSEPGRTLPSLAFSSLPCLRALPSEGQLQAPKP